MKSDKKSFATTWRDNAGTLTVPMWVHELSRGGAWPRDDSASSAMVASACMECVVRINHDWFVDMHNWC